MKGVYGVTRTGIFTIDTAADGAVDVRCKWSQGRMWTQVYKIADKSSMKTTGSTNVKALKDLEDVSSSGKLSDKAIRELCGEQFHLRQWQSSLSGFPEGIYCQFTDIFNFADNKQSEKQCDGSYSDNAYDYKKRLSSVSDAWGYNFGSWQAAGGIITQLNYRDGRKGSHIQNSAKTTDKGCSGAGGCHTTVFCLPN